MIERIESPDTLFAIVVRKEFHKDGIEFFTPNDFSQQLGYMKRPSGYEIAPHIHKPRNDTVAYTSETLFIRSGRVKVNFYHADKSYFQSCVLSAGDVILLAFGGHGFEFLEQSEIIEVKQGPYNGDVDKERF